MEDRYTDVHTYIQEKMERNSGDGALQMMNDAVTKIKSESELALGRVQEEARKKVGR